MRHATRPIAPTLLVLAGLLVAPAPASAGTRDLSFPDPITAPTGTQVTLEASDLPTEVIRETLLIEELLAGHHPPSQFDWKSVAWLAPDAEGNLHDVVLQVSPNYLAVGTDDDYMTAPLALPQAAVVARALGFWLPTPVVVDRIYEAAEHHYSPRPLPPTLEMRTPSYWLWHRAAMDGTSAGPAPEPFEGALPGELVAGQKKDVVLTARLQAAPRRLAIYGWHRDVGDPIQPLSLFHTLDYADYSHGVRAIAPTMWIDGEAHQYVDVLKDPVLCALVSDEGPVDAAAILATAIRIGASMGVIPRR